MTQKEIAAQIIRAADNLHYIQEHRDLLDIALENADPYSEKNFDRIVLLVRLYKELTEDSFDAIDKALFFLTENLRNK